MKSKKKKPRAKAKIVRSKAQYRLQKSNLAGVDRLIDIGIRHSLNGDAGRWWDYWLKGDSSITTK